METNADQRKREWQHSPLSPSSDAICDASRIASERTFESFGNWERKPGEKISESNAFGNANCNVSEEKLRFGESQTEHEARAGPSWPKKSEKPYLVDFVERRKMKTGNSAGFSLTDPPGTPGECDLVWK